MNVLILGLNYTPEPVGIGPYTHGMAVELARAHHQVTVVCGKPYYPSWIPDPAYVGGGVRRTYEDGVNVVRVPHYVPANPSGARRLLHHLSFAARVFPTLVVEARQRRPDIVIGIAPSLISLVGARFVARMFGAKLWLHVQDFEVEAAFATGLMKPGTFITKLARAFERWSLQADRVSTISPQMCAKLIESGIAPTRVVEFRNWADVDRIQPLSRPSVFRDCWNIDRPYVALYSGNIANKQGIGIVLEAAQLLAHRRDLIFVVCGNGPNRAILETSAIGLDNIRFFDLQSSEDLPELLALADVHLLPQIAGAADLVLPSKLTNMLASGRAVVATAALGTGLADEVEGCGVVTPPGDALAFADAITRLIDDHTMRTRLGATARVRAEERWSRNAILKRFEVNLQDATSKPDLSRI